MKALFFICWCFSLISFLTTSHCVASQTSYSRLSLRKDIHSPCGPQSRHGADCDNPTSGCTVWELAPGAHGSRCRLSSSRIPPLRRCLAPLVFAKETHDVWA